MNMQESNVMTLLVIGLEDFAREITYEGKAYQVQACSVNDTFEELDRAQSLLKNLLMNHLDDAVLNDIGMSDEDLSNLGMSSETLLDNNKIPPKKDWYE
jgi:hypothetical protein